MTDFDLDAYRALWQPRIDAALSEILDQVAKQAGCPRVLSEAMRHAVLGGGKRLRPLLTLAAVRSCGEAEESGLQAGCALELVHAYSLVHDDLPAMDNDDFRRGLPTCHRAFGEGMAILAGDALLTLAFQVLAEGVPRKQAASAVILLSRAAGPLGMVGGQMDDIQEAKGLLAVEQVEFIHARKTGAIFEAALRIGAMVAGAGRVQLESLGCYGRALGLAYQIADDLLAFAGDTKILGRPTGSDVVRKRHTHPLTVGPEHSRLRAQSLMEEALEALAQFGPDADALRSLARFVGGRVS